MTYHDLRPPELTATSPLHFSNLLNLGLKLCLEEERSKENVLVDCISRCKRDIRLKFTFTGCGKPDKCNKKIYVKLRWQPDNASNIVEECMSDFENGMREE